MKQARGFSIMEVLLALFVLGIISLVLFALLRGVPLSRFAEDQDIAAKIAVRELETLRTGGYGALPAAGSFSDSDLGALPMGVGTVAVTAYNAKTKKVVVTVSWQEPAGAASSTVMLATLVTEIGALP